MTFSRIAFSLLALVAAMIMLGVWAVLIWLLFSIGGLKIVALVFGLLFVVLMALLRKGRV